jgi:P-type E1-E2 ATPase
MGWFLCIGVGDVATNTRILKGYLSLSKDVEVTPLSKKLNSLARTMAIFGIIMVLLILGVLAAREIQNEFANVTDKSLLEFAISAIAIVFFAIPVTVPLAVMIILCYITAWMQKENLWVKKKQTCLKLGSINSICVDKTGTLTKNELSCTHIWLGVSKLIPTGDEKLTEDFCVKSTMDLLGDAISVNTIGTSEDSYPLDRALLKFIARGDIEY